jgi:hypothetical protein
MGQKKIKRSKTGPPPVDPNLEEVSEDRQFEIAYDEDDNEVIIVNHYRRKWGDEMDADVEHGWNISETRAVVQTLNELIDIMLKVETDRRLFQIGDKLVEKSTPELIEGNPLKNNSVQ